MSTDRTEYMKHYMRRWRLKNPELVKQLRLKEKEKNIDSPERKREYNQRYYLTHKEQLSVSQHNNREKKKYLHTYVA